MADLAKCIKMAMAKGDVSAAELGVALEVVPSTISRWRKTGCYSIRDLEKIAKTCGMSLDEMMRLAD